MSINQKLETRVMHFLVKDVRMCAYLKEINKVLPLVALEKIPNGPSYLAGLMNIGGVTVPVIDLALRIGLTRRKKYSLDTPVLLCTNGKKQVAMIVDTILELTDIDVSKLQMREEFNKPDSLFLASTIYNLESSLLINMNSMLETRLMGDDGSYAHKNETRI